MAEVKKENWFKRTWGKVAKYFRELRSELKKVVWPKRKELVRACLVVAACILVIGVFIWVVDGVAAAVIRALINLFKG